MEKAGKKTYTRLRDGLLLLIGSCLYAVGYRAFIEPSGLILGGATGVATLLAGLYAIPVGIGVLLVNAPLFLISAFRHGIGATVRMAAGVLASSILLDMLVYAAPIASHPALGALLGGAVSAIGIALLLTRDFTTGGSELAAILIQEKFSLLTVGKTVLLLDSTIVLLSAYLLGREEALFYSAVLNLVFSVTLDLVYKTPRLDGD